MEDDAPSLPLAPLDVETGVICHPLDRPLLVVVVMARRARRQGRGGF